jgi:hypothetical protein
MWAWRCGVGECGRLRSAVWYVVRARMRTGLGCPEEGLKASRAWVSREVVVEGSGS